jgi:hypothetical protein
VRRSEGKTQRRNEVKIRREKTESLERIDFADMGRSVLRPYTFLGDRVAELSAGFVD